MDHHCTFIGKCVGKKNIIAFNIFIIFTLLSIIYSILAFVGFAFNII